MAEGAPALRDALAAAVEPGSPGRELVSCDLGGLDSTALCSLPPAGRDHGARTRRRAPTRSRTTSSGRRTVAGLAGVEHEIIPAEEMPLVFDGLGRPLEDRFDEPCTATVDGARWLAIARRAAARGSRLHLTGFGGDELLYGSVAHLHDLLRTNPRTGAAQPARASPRSTGGPVGPCCASWPTPARTGGGWPAWRTPSPRRRRRRRSRCWSGASGPGCRPGPVERSGGGPRPDPGRPPRRSTRCHRRRGQQRELETMRYLSRMTRQLGQTTGRLGVALAAPYYDDRVVEAGLAVRPEERVTPWRYKPLIVEAMRGMVPADSLTRQTKANGSGDVEPGLRRHRAELLALWEDSRLGALGLSTPQRCARPARGRSRRSWGSACWTSSSRARSGCARSNPVTVPG